MPSISRREQLLAVRRLVQAQLRDTDATDAVLRLEFRQGVRVVRTEEEWHVLETLFVQHYAGDVAIFLATVGAACVQCDSLFELAFVLEQDERGDVAACMRRIYKGLYPAEQGIYSSEVCKVCHKKTVFHVNAQISAGDEESVFITVCTNCNA